MDERVEWSPKLEDRLLGRNIQFFACKLLYIISQIITYKNNFRRNKQ